LIAEPVSGFSSILGQKQPIRILTALLRKDTIPHALIFSGLKGVGKQAAALEFAKICNCTERNADRAITTSIDKSREGRLSNKHPLEVGPCGRCKSCRKIASGNHPDVIQIKPSGAYIKIAQIRALGQTLAMRPYEAKWRTVIISNAQAMNPAASNALLKMLEEPPAQTVLILTAGQRSDLLPTIVSRCQHIRFKPISQENLESYIIENREVTPVQARILASMAGGSYTTALDMADKNWFARRTWLLNEIAAIATRPTARIMALAEELSKNRETLQGALEVTQSWFRDVAIFRYDPGKVVHKDLSENIREASQKTNVSSQLSIIRKIHNVQQKIQTNANARLAVESLLLMLARP